MRLLRYEIVSCFELDETVIFSCGPILKRMQQNFGGNLIPISTPENAPPPLPRIVLQSKAFILKLALDRVSITVTPPAHVTDNIEKSSKYASQRVASVYKELFSVILNYEWTGIVAHLEFPNNLSECRSAVEAATPIFDKLINIDRHGKELSTFQFQFGFREDNLYVNYTIGGYENRSIKVDNVEKGKFKKIDIKDHPIDECGIQLMLDINNRLGSKTKKPIEDVDLLFSKQINCTETISIDTNLEDILS